MTAFYRLSLAALCALFLIAEGAYATNAWTKYGALRTGPNEYTETFGVTFTDTTDSAVLDVTRCNTMTRAFNASTEDTSTDAKYEIWSCPASDSAAGDCKWHQGIFSEHSETAFDVDHNYLMVNPTTAPSGDTARVVIECKTIGYAYDGDTSAWIATVDEDTRVSSVYFNDFLNTAANLDTTNDWTVVDVGTVTDNPIIVHGGANGILRSGGDASSQNEGASILLGEATANGQACDPTAGGVCEIEFRLTLQDQDTTDWFAGLCEDQASAWMDAAGDIAGSLEYVLFHYNFDDDTAGIPTLIYAGDNNTQAAVTASPVIVAGVDATYKRFGLKLVGDELAYWSVNGTEVGSVTVVSDFTAPLYPCVGHVSEDADADLDYIYVDYIRFEQSR